VYNVPTLPKPLPPSPLKKKCEKNEETMNVSVTENTFSSYIQLSKINNHVPRASLAKNYILLCSEANIKKTINSGTMDRII
jgi:hypothetical protein